MIRLKYSKIIPISACIILALITSKTYAAQAKTGVTVSGEMGYIQYYGSSNSVQIDDDSAKLSMTTGIILSPLISYHYALSDFFALGVTSGYAYSASAGGSINSSQNPSMSLNVNEVWSIPLLLSARFVTPIGFFAQTEAGLSYNRTEFTTVDTSDIPNTSINQSEYGINPQINLSTGYQFNFGLSLYIKYSHTFSSLTQSNYNDIFNNNAYTFGISYNFS
jgi:hypothetical protein